MKLSATEILSRADSLSAQDFVRSVTDFYLEYAGGQLTAESMSMLNTDQHTLLAYRYLLDEVMEGGFIQLIQNGYAGYVLEGPFPMVLKKVWGMKDLANLIYDVKREYHVNRDRFDTDISDEDFMALYEELEKLNDLGDDFLDDYQEVTTPQVCDYVVQNVEKFECGV